MAEDVVFGEISDAAASAELDAIALARQRRMEKHPRMRQLLLHLASSRFESQVELAQHLQIRPAQVSEYLTGQARSKKLSIEQLNTRHRELSRVLQQLLASE